MDWPEHKTWISFFAGGRYLGSTFLSVAKPLLNGRARGRDRNWQYLDRRWWRHGVTAITGILYFGKFCSWIDRLWNRSEPLARHVYVGIVDKRERRTRNLWDFFLCITRLGCNLWTDYKYMCVSQLLVIYNIFMITGIPSKWGKWNNQNYTHLSCKCKKEKNWCEIPSISPTDTEKSRSGQSSFLRQWTSPTEPGTYGDIAYSISLACHYTNGANLSCCTWSIGVAWL